ncbi:hypothetical protein ACQZ4Y_23470 [Rhizobium sp. L80/93]|uniref:hypothetical protein n=1 Tax=unclassified Rhizobium TaxID=2613769 RepID=UPI001ADBE5D1|nr:MULTISPECIES: hypothetical protein [unclassified Rhizobium]MBO9182728.1 hypothetical protein [Rhizobium sp. E27B/91]QYA04566.1 hypothetical protein J5278_20675 [Rhizobium sp. B21/90]
MTGKFHVMLASQNKADDIGPERSVDKGETFRALFVAGAMLWAPINSCALDGKPRGRALH